MTRDELLRAIQEINVWKRRGTRAPHKPLLLLLALGRVLRKQDRLARYEDDIEKPLKNLLKRFGPPRKVHHPEFPFRYLQNDGLWEVTRVDMSFVNARGDWVPSRLRRAGASGGFPEALYELLLFRPGLVLEAAQALLDGHFPRSLHDDIRSAVGIPYDWVADTPHTSIPARKRDPAFRDEVLRAYQRRCAVCDFDIRVEDELLGLEAAHIQWHAAGGPDIVPNGLALCVVHHKALYRGALGLQHDEEGRLKILISSEVSGLSGAVRWLLDFHHQPLRRPQHRAWEPRPDFVNWHTREVFRAPAKSPTANIE